MTKSPIGAINSEVLDLAVETNYGEDMTGGAKFSKINKFNYEMEIDLEEEQKTEAY